MKTILILIDSIQDSKEYMNYGIHLAKDLERNVVFLYMFNQGNIPLGAYGYAETVVHLRQTTYKSKIEHIENEFDTVISEFNANIQNTPTMECKIETGAPHDVINKFLENQEADMVMLKEYAKGKSTEFIRESNIEIIRKTHCPIWIIPEGVSYKAFNNIVYATDYHEEDIPALKKLSDIASVFKARITAFHLTENIDFEERIKSTGYSDILIEKVGYDKITMKLVPEEEGTEIAENILKFASGSEAGLIVLMKEDKGFLERIFTTSTTRKLAKHIKLPMLVYHEKFENV
jgi:nucleotide-binding universal stress UspA family protein